MKLNVTLSHFEELVKKNYSLDMVFLLKLVEQEVDISDLCKDSARVCALVQGLIRKALVTEEHKLTLQGKEILSFIETEGEAKIAKKKAPSTDFEQWWKTFPGTDTFTHKGMKFSGSRTLRQNKEECKLRFEKILLEGEYTLTDLIAALEYDVLQKKENSVKQKANKLTYLQNSLTYLNQRSYEPFIELIREGQKIEEADKPVGGTDI